MQLLGYTGMRPAGARTRALLYVAAAFNLVTAPLIVALARLAPQSLGVGAVQGVSLLFVDLAALLIAGFGWGYALAGRNLPVYWPMLAIGAVLKAGVVLVAFGHYAAGSAGPLVALLAAGDAVFALLFVGVLRRHGS
ncbi:MAG: hypothetical protein NDI84_04590 [Steroidobacteraceae bacterium]|nr:hypothetical protein [Steroidobacteraceae bacterium]